MKSEQVLQLLGLNENQTKIYLVLAEHESLTVSGISKHAGIHRHVIYKNIPHLIALNVISKTKNGKRLEYMAEYPEVFSRLIDSFKNDAEKTLEELQEKIKTRKRRPEITYKEGRAAISATLMDIVTSLKKHDIYYRYSSEKSIEKSKKYTPKKYFEMRDKKELERYVISHTNSEEDRDNDLSRLVKLIPKDAGLFEQNIVEVIYGNKVAYIDYDTDTALVIDDSRIADFNKKLFLLLYKKL